MAVALGIAVAIIVWLLIRKSEKDHHERKLKLIQDKIAAREKTLKERRNGQEEADDAD